MNEQPHRSGHSNGFTLIEFAVLIAIMMVVTLVLLRAGLIEFDVDVQKFSDQYPLLDLMLRGLLVVGGIWAVYLRFNQVRYWIKSESIKARSRGVPLVRTSVKVFSALSIAVIVGFFVWAIYFK